MMDYVVYSGEVMDGTTLNFQMLDVNSGGIATNTVADYYGSVYVYDGGTATNTTVNQLGTINVSSGGMAEDTIVNNQGWGEVFAGGSAHGATINSGGSFLVNGGGTAEEMTVNSGGHISFMVNATGSTITVAEGGAIDFAVAPDTYLQWTSAGSAFAITDATISGYVIDAGFVNVVSGGIANDTVVNAGTELWIAEGGTALRIVENGGFVCDYKGSEISFASNTFSGLTLNHDATVHSGTTAVSTTLNKNGILNIFEGGSAHALTVNKGAEVEIHEDATATQIVENGGYVWVNEGAEASFVSNSINGLELGRKEPEELELGEPEEEPPEEFREQKATVHSGTTATSTSLYEGGWLLVCDGGIAIDTIVDAGGQMDVYNGGLANGITFKGYCWARMRDGATLSGQIDVHGITEIHIMGDVDATNAEFNFIIDQQTSDDNALLVLSDPYWDDFDGIGHLSGGAYSITVGSNPMEYGTYRLVSGADDFDVTFTVKNTDSQVLGELTSAGNVLNYNGFGYSLALDDGCILLCISEDDGTDTTNPIISNITVDVTTPTKGNVTVTATATDNSGEVTLLYAKNGGAFTEYQSGVVFTENGSVVFKAVDGAGNETFSDAVEITNIDKVAPTFASITADVTEPTKGKVTVTVEVSDNSDELTLTYSKNGGAFKTYEGGVEFTANGSVVFQAVDAAGNKTISDTFEVTNIDKTAPVISNITADVTAPTNENVTVTATATDNSGNVTLYYAKNGGAYTEYQNGVEFTENGSVVFKAVDAAGNETLSDAFEVTNIDKVAPVFSNIAANVTTPTNGDVTVTATATDDSGNVTLSYSKNGGAFTTYKSGVKFTANGNVVFKAVDAAGNETLSDTFTVSNIDKIPPIISIIAADVDTPTNGKVKVTASASDDENDVEFYYAKNGGAFTLYQNGVEFTENGSVVFKAVDAAGNETLSDAFEVTNIDKTPPTFTSITADVTTPTNDKVKVTATATDNAGNVTLSYSKDGGSFLPYMNAVEFTVNGSVVFKAVDAAGNETLSDTFTVSNIDKVAPTISNILADETGPTNGTVTVTAIATANSGEATLTYSKNGGDFTLYQNGVEFTDNGSVIFKAIDSLGNQTLSDTFTVTNIDKTAPVISNIAADVTTLTKGKVTVTAIASDDKNTVTLYYSKNNGSFKAYQNGVEFTSNGKVVFKAVDAAGNETISNAFQVTNIDKTAPVITNIVADVTEPTNSTVTVTATATDNSGNVTLYYAKDGGAYTEYQNGVEFTENGSVVFKAVDAVGNTTISDAFTVTNIDKVAPVISNIKANKTTPTNGKVKVTATATDDVNDVTLLYAKNGGEFTAYQNGVEFTENGNVVFKAVDAAGNETFSDAFTVANIDKIPPIIAIIAADVDTATNGTVTVTASALDGENDVSFYYSKNGGDFTVYQNGVEFTENGSVVFKAVDAAGNETISDPFEVTNIDKTAPVISNIAANVTAPTKGNVTVTATATDNSNFVMLYYAKNGGEFTAYQSGVDFTENGNIVFKAVDVAGNETLSDTFVVSNIDKTAPVISNIAADVTAPTKNKVTVTATATDDVNDVTLLYAKNGGEFTEYQNGVEFTDNGNVVFKAVDAAGNETLSDAFQVTNIDKTAPTITSIAADVTTPTNGTVTVTATATDNAPGVTLFYAKNGEAFTAYQNGVEFTDNGSVVFKAVDAVGNETLSPAFAVTNIDKVAPTVSGVTIGEHDGDGNTAIAIVASEALSQLKYSWNGGDWTDYPAEQLLVSGQGVIKFKLVDLAGNETVTAEYPVAYSDDWTDRALNGPNSKEIGVFSNVTIGGTLQNEIGKDDTVDYMAITLDCASKLSFTLTSTNKAKLTLYNLSRSKAGKYSLKSLKSVSTKAGQSKDLKEVLVEAGTYYLCVQSTDKKADNAPYTVTLNDQSKFYTRGDDNSDNWLVSKGNPVNQDIPTLGTITTTGVLVEDGWVGFGDANDYMSFTLESAASITFDFKASDLVKLELLSVTEQNKQKSLKSKSCSNKQLNTVVSMPTVLLQAGTYYLAMKSINAKKGGDASYSISVKDTSIFFTRADNSDDGGNLKVDGFSVMADLGKITAVGSLVEDGWVGFSDEYDYMSFTLDNAADIAFDLNATGKAKIIVGSLTPAAAPTATKKYTSKSLTTATLKISGSVTTKKLHLGAGTYYLAVQATDAKKGANVSYTVSVNKDSVIYPAPDHTNDTWQAAKEKDYASWDAPIAGWVGFNDENDFYKFQVADAGKVSLTLDDTTKTALNAGEIKLSCLDANGNGVSLDALSGNVVNSSDALAQGDYYLGITCANTKKFNTSYSMSLAMLA